MKATFRPLRWTGPVTPADQRRSKWTFKASWQNTLNLLDDELYRLDAANLIIEADFTESEIRLDGMPKANARQPVHPGVRVFFDSKFGPLVYATDSCAFWQHNVRSIALGLEALRAVDRYGVTKRGEQYTGWKAIGAGTATPMNGAMTTADAARFIALHGDAIPEAITAMTTDGPGRKAAIDTVYRRAARKLHPDNGGNAAEFNKLMDARRILNGGAS